MSFAALKRKLVVGTKLELVQSPFANAPRPLVIEKVQTNAIAFAGDEYTKGRLSWLYWPKANEIEVTEDGFIRKNEDGSPRLVFKFA